MTTATIEDKVLALCNLAIENASDNDESVDWQREAELLEFQRGAEVISPVYLSGYDSRGDAPPVLQKVIDRCYAAQNAEWLAQHPGAPDMWEAYNGEDKELAREAEEWLDAALDDEWAYLQIEVTYDDSTVKWESRFTNEINGPLGHIGQGEIDRDEFETFDDEALEKLADQIAESAYDFPHWVSAE